MRHVQRPESVSTSNQNVDAQSDSIDVLHLLEALASAQSENETLSERVVFLTKQIEDMRSHPQTSEFDYEVLAEKVLQRVQSVLPAPQLQQLDQIEDLLQILDEMKKIESDFHSGEGGQPADRPDHEAEVVDQLHAIRDEIQRLSATT